MATYVTFTELFLFITMLVSIISLILEIVKFFRKK